MLPALASLVNIAMGRHAPAMIMHFMPGEALLLDPRAVSTIDGLGTVLNGLILTYCLLAYHVVQKCIASRQTWALRIFIMGIMILQISGYASDQFFDGKNMLFLHFSSLILIVGLGFCFWGWREPTAIAA
jgi:hypothetical protein